MHKSQLIEYKESWRDEYLNKDKLYISNRAGFIEESRKSNDTVNDDLLGKLSGYLEITYKAICENNQASNKKSADKTSQSERTIRNHTVRFKELNYIKRVGSEKTGHREIL